RATGLPTGRTGVGQATVGAPAPAVASTATDEGAAGTAATTTAAGRHEDFGAAPDIGHPAPAATAAEGGLDVGAVVGPAVGAAVESACPAEPAGRVGTGAPDRHGQRLARHHTQRGHRF